MSSHPGSVSCMSAPIMGILWTSVSWGTSFPSMVHRSLYLKLIKGMTPESETPYNKRTRACER